MEPVSVATTPDSRPCAASPSKRSIDLPPSPADGRPSLLLVAVLGGRAEQRGQEARAFAGRRSYLAPVFFRVLRGTARGSPITLDSQRKGCAKQGGEQSGSVQPRRRLRGGLLR